MNKELKFKAYWISRFIFFILVGVYSLGSSIVNQGRFVDMREVLLLLFFLCGLSLALALQSLVPLMKFKDAKKKKKISNISS